ncbi:MAG: hypothetical protein FD153_1791 [Rhodospirillaceae bacterium]|nr:MAG: hypothetical protein FD153_1791 [Rhodospirillaceae bacterium]
MALGSVSRGGFAAAEQHADKALFQDPKDPYGLFSLYAAGLVYKATAARRRHSKCSRNPAPEGEGVAILMGTGDLTLHLLTDLAAAYLRSLDANRTSPTHWPAPGPDESSLSSPSSPYRPLTPTGPVTPKPLKRFQVLRALQDGSLITEGEYRVRRDRNISSLLPLSSPPPAAGLHRPVPDTSDVAVRLKELRHCQPCPLPWPNRLLYPDRSHRDGGCCRTSGTSALG